MSAVYRSGSPRIAAVVAFSPRHPRHHARPRPRAARSSRSAATCRAGTIVVRTSERRLYLVLGQGRAMAYPVGVGRAGMQWAGRAIIDEQARPPGVGAAARHQARKSAAAGRHPRRRAEQSDGRRGADADRAATTPSTAPTIRARSAASCPTAASACTTQDITDLYGRVGVGTPVIVTR